MLSITTFGNELSFDFRFSFVSGDDNDSMEVVLEIADLIAFPWPRNKFCRRLRKLERLL